VSRAGLPAGQVGSRRAGHGGLLRSGLPLLSALLGLVLAGLGLHLLRQQPAAAAPDLARPAAASERGVHPPDVASAARDSPRAAPTGSAVLLPTRLGMPRQGVQAAILPVGVTRLRGLDLPPDPDTVGWWAGGTAPGQDVGSAVLAGHIDAAGYGTGALAALLDVGIGDPVEVTNTAGRVLHYQVTARVSYPKAALPAAVFRTDGPPTLTLITCGGPFDSATHHYRDNIVVSAAPIPGQAERLAEPSNDRDTSTSTSAQEPW